MALSFKKKREPQDDGEQSASVDGESPPSLDADITDGEGPPSDGPDSGIEVEPAPSSVADLDVLDESAGAVELEEEKAVEAEKDAADGDAADEDADLLSLFDSEEEEDIDMAALTTNLVDIDCESLLDEALDVSARLKSSLDGN